jgi:hypothetical protein
MLQEKREENHQSISLQEIDKMLEEWDLVRCYYCGKKISILNAKLISEDEHFVCKQGC